MEKQCSVCKQIKSLNEYNRNSTRKDGLQTLCKACSSQRTKAYYKNNTVKHRNTTKKRRKKYRKIIRDFIIEVKKINPCLFCDESEPVCLDFHHMRDKFKEIAMLCGRTSSLSAIIEELKKCACICANCHRKIHANILDSSKLTVCKLPPVA